MLFAGVPIGDRSPVTKHFARSSFKMQSTVDPASALPRAYARVPAAFDPLLEIPCANKKSVMQTDVLLSWVPIGDRTRDDSSTSCSVTATPWAPCEDTVPKNL